MRVELGIGDLVQEVCIPDEMHSEVLLPNEKNHDLTGSKEVRRALRHPIGTPVLRDIVKAGEKVAIVTSDITRPVPSQEILPALLDELYAAGAKPEDLTLVFALGSHRRHTEEEKKKLAGDRVYREIRCVDSDPEDCMHLGVTARGTPVDITRTVAEADRRICVGNIEYHYFAGYSGGGKAIMPGVSTRAAIQANHRMMTDPQACAGRLDDNPVREDIEEAAAICGVDFILNVVLDEHRKIVYATAGDAVEAHWEGCRYLDGLYQKKIRRKADIVIVSQGGAPKDLNLYQTQKALDNAKHAVKKGGSIILVGSCREGLGEATFEKWMTEARTPEDLTRRIEYKFELGGHKAAAIALVLEQADIYLVSDLEPEFVKTLFMKPYNTVQSAFEAAVRKQGADSRVIVMPYGGSTFPCPDTEKTETEL